MRIQSLHIENFGKLSNLNVSFNEGINTITHENGWGKSTMMAFIRVMFYGFEGENKKSNADRERNKLRPWQGGVFGGSLTFESEGKSYVVSRTFGMKPEEDTFSVRDLTTNLQTSGFSNELGKDIFKIDSDSFIRTIFIGQNDIDAGTTGDINAKIGNLTDNTNDINNYDTAMNRMKNAINALTPARATGSLNRLSKDIANLRTDIFEEGTILDSMGKIQALIDGIEAEKASINHNQVELSRTMQEVSRKKDLLARASRYQQILHNFQITELSFEQSKLAIDVENEGSNINAEAAAREVTVLSELIGKWNDRSNRKNELLIRKIDEENRKRVALEEKNIESEIEEKTNPLIVAGIVSIIAAVIVFIITMMIKKNLLVVEIALAVLGLVLIAIGIFVPYKKRDETKHETQDDYETESYKASLKREEEYILGIEESVKNYLESKGNRYDEYSALGILQMMQREAIEKAATSKANIAMFSTLKKKYEDALAEKENFERENDTEELASVNLSDPLPDLATITQRFNDNVQKLAKLNDGTDAYEDQLRELQDRLDEINLKKETLEELSSRYDSEETKLHRIEKAKDFLTKSKENMIARYIDPLKNGFIKYYEIITGSTGRKFFMDVNTNVTYEEKGLQRDTITLSRGYRDLTMLCLRLSFIDAMYKDEKPMIIMDDTFVNLDRRNSDGALRLLREISKKYQIIYFTCK